MPRRSHSTAPERERAYLVAVRQRGRPDAAASGSWNVEHSLDELGELVRASGGTVAGRAVQNMTKPHPAHYIGQGKMSAIKSERESTGYNIVVFDDELSPTQQRNLEKALDVKVLDRTALILDIFAMRARTREGRLQVDLAQSEYLLPRLAGQWSHLNRMGGSGAQGAIGMRGPGETQLETDRRHARSKITRLKREIENVRKQRSLYRRRRARSGVPVVALVGYTNAGKSTMMRALTDADVLVADQLFATLDPITRRVHLPGGREALLTDTVGFIQKLPTQLVAAFKATLEELAEADVLLHVLDITHPDAAQQGQAVDDTIAELGLAELPRVTALNKIDLLVAEDGEPVHDLEELESFDMSLAEHWPDAVLTSAERGWGLEKLLERIASLLATRASAATPIATRE